MRGKNRDRLEAEKRTDSGRKWKKKNRERGSRVNREGEEER